MARVEDFDRFAPQAVDLGDADGAADDASAEHLVALARYKMFARQAWAEAVPLCQRAVALAAGSRGDAALKRRCKHALAWAHTGAQEEPAKALRAFRAVQRAAESPREAAEARLGEAFALYRQERIQESLEAFGELAEGDDEAVAVEARFLRALMILDDGIGPDGDVDLALSELRAVATAKEAMGTASGDEHLELGRMLSRRGDWAAARPEFQAAADAKRALGTLHGDELLSLGAACRNVGDHEAALQAYLGAAVLLPEQGHPSADTALGMAERVRQALRG